MKTGLKAICLMISYILSIVLGLLMVAGVI